MNKFFEKIKKSLIIFVTGVAFLTIATSCDENADKDANNVSVTGLTLNVSAHSMSVGDNFTLTATVEPAEAANQELSWNINEAGRTCVSISVSPDGKTAQVTANAVGTATITVLSEDGGRAFFCNITVIDDAFDPPTMLFSPDETIILDPKSAPVVLSWSEGAESAGLNYDVIFADVSASFDTPVEVKSAESGKTQLSVTHLELDMIAKKLGAGLQGTATIKWTVRASKGVVSKFSAVSSSFDVVRPSVDISDYSTRAKELYDLIRPKFLITSGACSGLYREEYDKTQQSYLWPFDAWLSAVTELHKLGHNVNYASEVANAQRYYTTGTGYPIVIPAYGSATNGASGSGTRFYDDNAIIGMNLVEAYRLSGNTILLDYCRQIVAFLKTGEDSHLGGAMWWNEAQKNSNSTDPNHNKPTCSNGYGVCFLLEYYTVCPQSERADVLSFARRLYTWLYANLRDPADNTYWNAVQASGAVQTTKWTYNSGIMIKNGVLLYQITNESQYLDHAKATATGSYNHFVRFDANAGIFAYPNRDPWFNTKLLTAYITIAPYMPQAKDYINTYIDFADYGYKNSRTADGLFYEGWVGNTGRYQMLLMQAAAIESYGAIARYISSL